MKKMKKLALLLLAAVLMVCLLAGCGGTIDTKLTVDKNFAGQRVMTVTVTNSDISKNVVGGINALKTVADNNLPSEMTCALSTVDGASVLTFTIAFQNIEEYRTKVAAIVDAGTDESLVPEIVYENSNTVFKSGVKFAENFTSFDLLQWYFVALQEADIITHSSTSQWYELGDSVLTVDGTAYDVYSKMSVNEQELNCLNSIDVATTMNIDGTFHREIVFSAYDSNIEKLAANNCNLTDYLRKLTVEGDVFEETTTGTLHEYTIAFDAADVNALVARTNAILQTENTFSVEVSLDTENLGMAKVVLKERLDGSYYLDYSGYGSPMQSTIDLYDNIDFSAEADTSADLTDGVLTYTPSATSDVTFHFDWQISFATVEIIADVRSEEDTTVELLFATEETMAEEFKKSAIEALKVSCGENGQFDEDGNSCSMIFKGSVGEASNKIDAFIRSQVETPIEGRSYFTLSLEEAETASKFTNGFVGGITYDLSPIIGQTRILFNDTDGLLVDYYYQGNFQTNTEGDRTAACSGTVSFALIKISLITIILTALLAACVIAGAVLLVVNRNQIVELVRTIAAKKPTPTVADVPSEETQVPAVDNNAVPVSANEESVSEEEETEEIL